MAKLISVIVPCYNEQEVLHMFYDEMSRVAGLMTDYNFEFIFVNDGSRDNTLNICKELAAKDEEELLDLLIDQPIAIDVDKQEEAKMTNSDKIADKVSEVCGSWLFIIVFMGFLLGWIILNTVILVGDKSIDPYPFILLNLVLSCISALQAPIIMMSQNRQAAKDSLRNQNDYRTDLKSELILETLHDQMDVILRNQKICKERIT